MLDVDTLKRIRQERLDRVDDNLRYLKIGEDPKRVERLEKDAVMMKAGIDDLYYILWDLMTKENKNS